MAGVVKHFDVAFATWPAGTLPVARLASACWSVR